MVLACIKENSLRCKAGNNQSVLNADENFGEMTTKLGSLSNGITALEVNKDFGDAAVPEKKPEPLGRT